MAAKIRKVIDVLGKMIEEIKHLDPPDASIATIEMVGILKRFQTISESVPRGLVRFFQDTDELIKKISIAYAITSTTSADRNNWQQARALILKALEDLTTRLELADDS